MGERWDGSSCPWRKLGVRCAVAALRTAGALQVTRVCWKSAAKPRPPARPARLKRGLGGNRNVHRRSEATAPPEEQGPQYTSGQRESLEPQVLSGFFAPFWPTKKGLAPGGAKRPHKICRFCGNPAEFHILGRSESALRQGFGCAKTLGRRTPGESLGIGQCQNTPVPKTSHT